MGQRILMLLTVSGVLAGAAMTAQAHHSWGAVYNGGERVNDLRATIAGNYARRPHDAIAVTITNELGEPERWTIQWRGGRGQQYDFNIGDEVIIDGRMARNKSQKLIQMTSLVRPADGWRITAPEGRR